MLLIGAHFSRANENGLVITCLALLFLLFIKRRWVANVFQGLLLVASIEWIQTTLRLVQLRQAHGQPWTRLAIILSVVALFTALAALVFESKSLKKRYADNDGSETTSAFVFLLTILLLGIVLIKVKTPILIVERFFPGLGWIEIFLLALYARWIVEKILDPMQTAQWRSRIWLFFSIVFFSQLILGLIGFEKFLMTGRLHLPIPALIVAGPLYRGERFFMPILFLVTVLLVGSAWCSHLCYIGSWDNFAARKLKHSKSFPKWRRKAQIGMLIFIIAIIIVLRITGVPVIIATILAIIFGIIGVGLMVFWSRKIGLMTHCLTYCPIGVLATWLGKINPFRVRIADGCTECRACTLICRYDALRIEDIKQRKPASSCTLCGDCIESCKGRWIQYWFLRLKPDQARKLFLVLVVTIHTVFLGMARI